MDASQAQDMICEEKQVFARSCFGGEAVMGAMTHETWTGFLHGGCLIGRRYCGGWFRSTVYIAFSQLADDMTPRHCQAYPTPRILLLLPSIFPSSHLLLFITVSNTLRTISPRVVLRFSCHQ